MALRDESGYSLIWRIFFDCLFMIMWGALIMSIVYYIVLVVIDIINMNVIDGTYINGYNFWNIIETVLNALLLVLNLPSIGNFGYLFTSMFLYYEK